MSQSFQCHSLERSNLYLYGGYNFLSATITSMAIKNLALLIVEISGIGWNTYNLIFQNRDATSLGQKQTCFN